MGTFTGGGTGIKADSTDTLTNKTFNANGTGNSLSNVDVADLANGTAGQLITWDANGVAAVVAVGTAAQVLTSNGAGAAPTFQAAAGGSGAVTREGGQLTEVTTTSTADNTDLIAAASLTIAAAEPFLFYVVIRKTSGAAVNCQCGYTANATLITAASGAGVWQSGAANQAEDGGAIIFVGARVTNYLTHSQGLRMSNVSSTGAGVNQTTAAAMGTNPLPNAQITDWNLEGQSGNSAVTLGGDEGNIYSFANA